MAREGKLGELGKNPLAVGAMAVQFGVQGAAQVDLSGVDCNRPFPSPQEVDPAATLSTGNSPRAMNYSRLAGVPWLMAAGALGVALVGYPRLNQILYDNDCFIKADTISARDHSPTALREYLADPNNIRHREAAQRQINGYYDVAIARLKKRAENNPKVDQKLFGALLALVEGLKTANSPVVTVGFNSRQEVEPVTDAEKRAEKAAYDYRLKDNSELREIARNSGNFSAILPTGRCFSAAETVQREGVIVRSLQEAMKSVLDADILTLVPAKEGQKPLIEVNYHTAPSGGFFLYHTTVRNSYGSTTDRVNGLLRGYSTDWLITLRPPGGAKEYACRLASAPKSRLVYKDNPNDPVWAPYSVILYSGFWRMSAELVSEFAMNPGPDRVEFSYAEVASSK
jgi:molybdopterin-guanine dinucleotide biosynthesis protein